MDQAMIVALAPQLILSFGIVLTMLLVAWKRTKILILNFTVLIFILALFAVFELWDLSAIQVTTLLKVDSYGLFSLALILISATVIAIFSGFYLSTHTEVHDEYYLLLQLVVFGAAILVVSDHFASVFLGFELVSIALVGMVGYLRDSQYGLESAFKYLILSATASSFMLLGIAYIYGITGSLSFTLPSDHLTLTNLYTAGVVLFLLGLSFKLSLVPFHYWTPDVYQGAPTPVTMLLATVSKVAIFTVLIKYWFSLDNFNNATLVEIISIIAVLSMLIGNVLALRQTNLKRLFGFSSIAHMGYLLIVLLITSSQSIAFAWQAALFYLVAYVIASLSVFMVIIVSKQANELDKHLEISDWQGLFWQKPLLATAVIISILSFAGIPLTMGFIGKFYLITQATQQHLWLLVSALIAGSGIALFYYLRIIFVLFEPTDDVGDNISADRDNTVITIPILSGVVITLFAITGIVLGILPDLFVYFLPT